MADRARPDQQQQQQHQHSSQSFVNGHPVHSQLSDLQAEEGFPNFHNENLHPSSAYGQSPLYPPPPQQQQYHQQQYQQFEQRQLPYSPGPHSSPGPRAYDEGSNNGYFFDGGPAHQQDRRPSGSRTSSHSQRPRRKRHASDVHAELQLERARDAAYEAGYGDGKGAMVLDDRGQPASPTSADYREGFYDGWLDAQKRGNSHAGSHAGSRQEEYDDEEREEYEEQQQYGDHRRPERHRRRSSHDSRYNPAVSRHGHDDHERKRRTQSSAEDKRPTLGDSMLLAWDTLKGALSGRRE